MNIAVIDSDPISLNILARRIENVCKSAVVFSSTDPSSVINNVKQNNITIEVVFLGTQIGDFSGIDIAMAFKELNPRINIIFQTDSRDFYEAAFAIRASGYILKPITDGKLIEEFNNLRYPIRGEIVETKGIMAITFGKFGLFNNGKPVKFKRSKSEELLAYLIDRRGVVVSRREAASILFVDSNYTRTVQNKLGIIVHDLEKDLMVANANSIFVNEKGGYSVDTTAFECDSYAFLRGSVNTEHLYCGEYMEQYEWGEYFKDKFQ